MQEISRRVFLGAGAAAVAAAGTGRPARAADRPPNVVFILADQMRGDAMGCMGNPNAYTPNLDRMAAEGVLCDRCFANNPVCTPSRISMFTGKYPHEHGKLTNQIGPDLTTREETLLGYFESRGYRLGWIGKNHTYDESAMGGLDAYSERRREPFRKYVDPHVPPWWHGDMYWPAEACSAPQTTAEAVAFMESAKREQPFFLHVSYFDPHPPYFAPAEWAKRIAERGITIPEYIDPARLSDRLAEQQRALYYDEITDADLEHTMRYYYASVAWGVDLQVGLLLEALEEQGLQDDTIILFSSEHGDFMGHHRMVRKAMFLYDNLLHVPMIWYAPGRIASGHRTSNLAQGVDIMPTLIDLTGGEAVETSGRSLRPFLEGESRAEPDFTVFASARYDDLPKDYFENPEPFVLDSDRPLHQRVQDLSWDGEQRTIMARTRDWKLILEESRPPQLFNMAGGTVERDNVYDAPGNEAVKKRLEQAAREEWDW